MQQLLCAVACMDSCTSSMHAWLSLPVLLSLTPGQVQPAAGVRSWCWSSSRLHCPAWRTTPASGVSAVCSTWLARQHTTCGANSRDTGWRGCVADRTGGACRVGVAPCGGWTVARCIWRLPTGSRRLLLATCDKQQLLLDRHPLPAGMAAPVAALLPEAASPFPPWNPMLFRVYIPVGLVWVSDITSLPPLPLPVPSLPHTPPTPLHTHLPTHPPTPVSAHTRHPPPSIPTHLPLNPARLRQRSPAWRRCSGCWRSPRTATPT
jgi:hypothetical protein